MAPAPAPDAPKGDDPVVVEASAEGAADGRRRRGGRRKAEKGFQVAEAVDAEPPLADVVAPRRRTLLDRLFVGLRVHPVARPVDDG